VAGARNDAQGIGLSDWNPENIFQWLLPFCVIHGQKRLALPKVDGQSGSLISCQGSSTAENPARFVVEKSLI
jgi:hypothetical protein